MSECHKKAISFILQNGDNDTRGNDLVSLIIEADEPPDSLMGYLFKDYENLPVEFDFLGNFLRIGREKDLCSGSAAGDTGGVTVRHAAGEVALYTASRHAAGCAADETICHPACDAGCRCASNAHGHAAENSGRQAARLAGYNAVVHLAACPHEQ